MSPHFFDSPFNSARRDFLKVAAGGATALLTGCLKSDVTNPLGNTLANATLENMPTAPTKTIAPGQYDLHTLGSRGRLYVPTGYTPSKPAPLLVMMHGAGTDSSEWLQAPLLPLYDAAGALVLAPDSTDGTWDLILRGFGPDVKVLDGALKVVYNYCNVNPQQVTLGGMSDGATYALSLGLPNGELFTHLMAFSPGYLSAPGRRGMPRIYIAHGLQDLVLPIDTTSRTIVPVLRQQGYDVTFNEFTGGHAIYLSVVTQAFTWLGLTTPSA